MVSQKVGSYAFLAGVIIALLAGLLFVVDSMMETAMLTEVGVWIPLVLVILGLIVGVLNIHDKHISDFLIAAIAVAMIGLVALDPAMMVANPIVDAVKLIVLNIVYMVAPAALIVGLKQIFVLAKDQVA